MKATATLVIAAVILAIGSFPSNAADLGKQSGPNYCFVMKRSPILDLHSVDAMQAEVAKRYDHSVEVAYSDKTIASRSPRYPWASETKAACGKAIGYFRGSEVNSEMISKCDCYYGRMMRFVF